MVTRYEQYEQDTGLTPEEDVVEPLAPAEPEPASFDDVVAENMPDIGYSVGGPVAPEQPQFTPPPTEPVIRSGSQFFEENTQLPGDVWTPSDSFDYAEEQGYGLETMQQGPPQMPLSEEAMGHGFFTDNAQQMAWFESEVEKAIASGDVEKLDELEEERQLYLSWLQTMADYYDSPEYQTYMEGVDYWETIGKVDNALQQEQRLMQDTITRSQGIPDAVLRGSIQTTPGSDEGAIPDIWVRPDLLRDQQAEIDQRRRTLANQRYQRQHIADLNFQADLGALMAEPYGEANRELQSVLGQLGPGASTSQVIDLLRQQGYSPSEKALMLQTYAAQNAPSRGWDYLQWMATDGLLLQLEAASIPREQELRSMMATGDLKARAALYVPPRRESVDNSFGRMLTDQARNLLGPVGGSLTEWGVAHGPSLAESVAHYAMKYELVSGATRAIDYEFTLHWDLAKTDAMDIWHAVSTGYQHLPEEAKGVLGAAWYGLNIGAETGGREGYALTRRLNLIETLWDASMLTMAVPLAPADALLRLVTGENQLGRLSLAEAAPTFLESALQTISLGMWVEDHGFVMGSTGHDWITSKQSGYLSAILSPFYEPIIGQQGVDIVSGREASEARAVRKEYMTDYESDLATQIIFESIFDPANVLLPGGTLWRAGSQTGKGWRVQQLARGLAARHPSAAEDIVRMFDPATTSWRDLFRTQHKADRWIAEHGIAIKGASRSEQELIDQYNLAVYLRHQQATRNPLVTDAELLNIEQQTRADLYRQMEQLEGMRLDQNDLDAAIENQTKILREIEESGVLAEGVLTEPAMTPSDAVADISNFQEARVDATVEVIAEMPVAPRPVPVDQAAAQLPPSIGEDIARQVNPAPEALPTVHPPDLIDGPDPPSAMQRAEFEAIENYYGQDLSSTIRPDGGDATAADLEVARKAIDDAAPRADAATEAQVRAIVGPKFDELFPNGIAIHEADLTLDHARRAHNDLHASGYAKVYLDDGAWVSFHNELSTTADRIVAEFPDQTVGTTAARPGAPASYSQLKQLEELSRITMHDYMREARELAEEGRLTYARVNALYSRALEEKPPSPAVLMVGTAMWNAGVWPKQYANVQPWELSHQKLTDIISARLQDDPRLPSQWEFRGDPWMREAAEGVGEEVLSTVYHNNYRGGRAFMLEEMADVNRTLTRARRVRDNMDFIERYLPKFARSADGSFAQVYDNVADGIPRIDFRYFQELLKTQGLLVQKDPALKRIIEEIITAPVNPRTGAVGPHVAYLFEELMDERLLALADDRAMTRLKQIIYNAYWTSRHNGQELGEGFEILSREALDAVRVQADEASQEIVEVVQSGRLLEHAGEQGKQIKVAGERVAALEQTQNIIERPIQQWKNALGGSYAGKIQSTLDEARRPKDALGSLLVRESSIHPDAIESAVETMTNALASYRRAVASLSPRSSYADVFRHWMNNASELRQARRELSDLQTQASKTLAEARVVDERAARHVETQAELSPISEQNRWVKENLLEEGVVESDPNLLLQTNMPVVPDTSGEQWLADLESGASDEWDGSIFDKPEPSPAKPSLSEQASRGSVSKHLENGKAQRARVKKASSVDVTGHAALKSKKPAHTAQPPPVMAHGAMPTFQGKPTIFIDTGYLWEKPRGAQFRPQDAGDLARSEHMFDSVLQPHRFVEQLVDQIPPGSTVVLGGSGQNTRLESLNRRLTERGVRVRLYKGDASGYTWRSDIMRNLPANSEVIVVDAGGNRRGIDLTVNQLGEHPKIKRAIKVNQDGKFDIIEQPHKMQSKAVPVPEDLRKDLETIDRVVGKGKAKESLTRQERVGEVNVPGRGRFQQGVPGRESSRLDEAMQIFRTDGEAYIADAVIEDIHYFSLEQVRDHFQIATGRQVRPVRAKSVATSEGIKRAIPEREARRGSVGDATKLIKGLEEVGWVERVPAKEFRRLHREARMKERRIQKLVDGVEIKEKVSISPLRERLRKRGKGESGDYFRLTEKGERYVDHLKAKGEWIEDPWIQHKSHEQQLRWKMNDDAVRAKERRRASMAGEQPNYMRAAAEEIRHEQYLADLNTRIPAMDATEWMKWARKSLRDLGTEEYGSRTMLFSARVDEAMREIEQLVGSPDLSADDLTAWLFGDHKLPDHVVDPNAVDGEMKALMADPAMREMLEDMRRALLGDDSSSITNIAPTGGTLGTGIGKPFDAPTRGAPIRPLPVHPGIDGPKGMWADFEGFVNSGALWGVEDGTPWFNGSQVAETTLRQWSDAGLIQPYVGDTWMVAEQGFRTLKVRDDARAMARAKSADAGGGRRLSKEQRAREVAWTMERIESGEFPSLYHIDQHVEQFDDATISAFYEDLHAQLGKRGELKGLRETIADTIFGREMNIVAMPWLNVDAITGIVSGTVARGTKRFHKPRQIPKTLNVSGNWRQVLNTPAHRQAWSKSMAQYYNQSLKDMEILSGRWGTVDAGGWSNSKMSRTMRVSDLLGGDIMMIADELVQADAAGKYRHFDIYEDIRRSIKWMGSRNLQGSPVTLTTGQTVVPFNWKRDFYLNDPHGRMITAAYAHHAEALAENWEKVLPHRSLGQMLDVSLEDGNELKQFFPLPDATNGPPRYSSDKMTQLDRFFSEIDPYFGFSDDVLDAHNGELRFLLDNIRTELRQFWIDDVRPRYLHQGAAPGVSPYWREADADDINRFLFPEERNDPVDLERLSDNISAFIADAEAKRIGYKPGEGVWVDQQMLRMMNGVRRHLAPLWMTMVPRFHVNNTASGVNTILMSALRGDNRFNPFAGGERVMRLADVPGTGIRRSTYASSGFGRGHEILSDTSKIDLKEEELSLPFWAIGPVGKQIEYGTKIGDTVERTFKELVWSKEYMGSYSEAWKRQMNLTWNRYQHHSLPSGLRADLEGAMGLPEVRVAVEKHANDLRAAGVYKDVLDSVLAGQRSALARAHNQAYMTTMKGMRDYRMRNKIDIILDRIIPVHYWSTKNLLFVTGTALDRPASILAAARAYDAWSETWEGKPGFLNQKLFAFRVPEGIPFFGGEEIYLRPNNITNPLFYSIPNAIKESSEAWQRYEDMGLLDRILNTGRETTKSSWEALGLRVGPQYEWGIRGYLGAFDSVEEDLGLSNGFTERFNRGLKYMADKDGYYRTGILPVGIMNDLAKTNDHGALFLEYLNEKVYGTRFSRGEATGYTMQLYGMYLEGEFGEPGTDAALLGYAQEVLNLREYGERGGFSPGTTDAVREAIDRTNKKRFGSSLASWFGAPLTAYAKPTEVGYEANQRFWKLYRNGDYITVPMSVEWEDGVPKISTSYSKQAAEKADAWNARIDAAEQERNRCVRVGKDFTGCQTAYDETVDAIWKEADEDNTFALSRSSRNHDAAWEYLRNEAPYLLGYWMANDAGWELMDAINNLEMKGVQATATAAKDAFWDDRTGTNQKLKPYMEDLARADTRLDADLAAANGNPYLERDARTKNNDEKRLIYDALDKLGIAYPGTGRPPQHGSTYLDWRYGHAPLMGAEISGGSVEITDVSGSLDRINGILKRDAMGALDRFERQDAQRQFFMDMVVDVLDLNLYQSNGDVNPRFRKSDASEPTEEAIKWLSEWGVIRRAEDRAAEEENRKPNYQRAAQEWAEDQFSQIDWDVYMAAVRQESPRAAAVFDQVVDSYRFSEANKLRMEEGIPLEQIFVDPGGRLTADEFLERTIADNEETAEFFGALSKHLDKYWTMADDEVVIIDGQRFSKDALKGHIQRTFGPEYVNKTHKGPADYARQFVVEGDVDLGQIGEKSLFELSPEQMYKVGESRYAVSNWFYNENTPGQQKKLMELYPHAVDKVELPRGGTRDRFNVDKLRPEELYDIRYENNIPLPGYPLPRAGDGGVLRADTVEHRQLATTLRDGRQWYFDRQYLSQADKEKSWEWDAWELEHKAEEKEANTARTELSPDPNDPIPWYKLEDVLREQGRHELADYVAARNWKWDQLDMSEIRAQGQDYLMNDPVGQMIYDDDPDISDMSRYTPPEIRRLEDDFEAAVWADTPQEKENWLIWEQFSDGNREVMDFLRHHKGIHEVSWPDMPEFIRSLGLVMTKKDGTQLDANQLASVASERNGLFDTLNVPELWAKAGVWLSSTPEGSQLLTWDDTGRYDFFLENADPPSSIGGQKSKGGGTGIRKGSGSGRSYSSGSVRRASDFSYQGERSRARASAEMENFFAADPVLGQGDHPEYGQRLAYARAASDVMGNVIAHFDLVPNRDLGNALTGYFKSLAISMLGTAPTLESWAALLRWLNVDPGGLMANPNAGDSIPPGPQAALPSGGMAPGISAGIPPMLPPELQQGTVANQQFLEQNTQLPTEGTVVPPPLDRGIPGPQ